MKFLKKIHAFPFLGSEYPREVPMLKIKGEDKWVDFSAVCVGKLC
jgi:hypothetical protein